MTLWPKKILMLRFSEHYEAIPGGAYEPAPFKKDINGWEQRIGRAAGGARVLLVNEQRGVVKSVRPDKKHFIARECVVRSPSPTINSLPNGL